MPAPGRGSTTTGWPHASESPFATARATRSPVPPGTNAVTIRTTRDGYGPPAGLCAFDRLARQTISDAIRAVLFILPNCSGSPSGTALAIFRDFNTDSWRRANG